MRTCDPAAAQSLIGQPTSESLLARAKQLSGARVVRILRPHVPQAMNFNSGRLNVEIDRSGRVTRFSCG